MDRNKMLLDFASDWTLDGDLLRCRECKSACIASREDEEFVHRSDCKKRRTGARGAEWLYRATHPRALDAVPRPKGGWHAVLIDPPYTDADHAKYASRTAFPQANHLLRLGLDLVKPGGRVGVLHYVWPQPPKTARSIACIGVVCGFNNRMRCFSVFERIAEAAGGGA